MYIQTNNNSNSSKHYFTFNIYYAINMCMYVSCNDYDQSVPCTSLGSVYVYSMTGGIWSLIQTFNGFSTYSWFGNALSYSSTGTQFAVGAPFYNSYTGMYEMYDACM